MSQQLPLPHAGSCSRAPRCPRSILGIFLAAALLPLPATAQTSTSDATLSDTMFRDEIVVSANRRELPRGAVGSTVTVFDADEIDRLGTLDVYDLLRTVPGVEIVRTAGPGSLTSVFLRGGESYHTLVLVDGVRANNNTTGGFDLADIKVDNIERVEVLRGPQGTLYGSDAVAGVISITTRRGVGAPRVWGAVEGGDADLRHLRAGLAGGDERFDYSLSFADLETDGVSSAAESAGNTEVDPYTNTTITGRVGGRVGDGRLEVTARHAEGDVGLDGFLFGVGPVDDLDYVQQQETTTVGVAWSGQITDRWQQTVRVGNHRGDLEGIDPTDPFNNFTIDSESTELSAQADITLTPNGLLSIGYRVEERSAENLGSFDESIDLQAFYAQTEWTWNDRHHLAVSLRRDDVSDESGLGDAGETTGRLTLSSHLSDIFRLHGSVGTGFRTPSLNERFFPFFGNLDLAPETNEGWDLGVEAVTAGGAVVIDVTVFDNRFEDLILFTFPGGFQNVAEATSEGVEASLEWRPNDRFDLRVSHTVTETENVATGAPLARRPKDRSVVQLGWRPVEWLRSSLSVIAVADRIDSDGGPMDDYERVDLATQIRLKDRWWVTVRVDNLFDEDYTEVPGFTTPGRLARVGLRLAR
ncbi:MAG: TonB-dependent receptor [Acidobacteriota bacterium]